MSREFPGADKDPQATERKVLNILNALGPYQNMQRRAISRRVWSTDLSHATSTASAIGRLKNAKLIVEIRHGQYRITEAGRAALALDDELSGGAA